MQGITIKNILEKKGKEPITCLTAYSKPMAEINGAPFLCHLMDYWVGQGAKHFVLSVGFMKEFVIQYFGNGYKDIPITYVEEEKPLGTGGALIKSFVERFGGIDIPSLGPAAFLRVTQRF